MCLSHLLGAGDTVKTSSLEEGTVHTDTHLPMCAHVYTHTRVYMHMHAHAQAVSRA